MDGEALYHMQRGVACYNNADFESAVEEFSRLLEIDSKASIAHLYRALAIRACGDPVEGWREYEIVFREDPSSGYSFFAKARLFLEDRTVLDKGDLQKVYLETIELYSQAIKLAQDFSLTYFSRGELRYELDDFNGAVEDFDRTIKFDSSFALGYVKRAQARAKIGEYRSAIRDLEFFLELPLGAARNDWVMRNISAYWYQLSMQAEVG